jgi:hypothetical protein
VSETKKYASIWEGPTTVAEFIELLSCFPKDWRVVVKTPAGGGIGVEHREIGGESVVGIFGKNGGIFGENPLTEDEYRLKSAEFLRDLNCGRAYTSVHGDHRLYSPSLGSQATCYGTHYDRRVIERMVREGLVAAASVDLERVASFDRGRT